MYDEYHFCYLSSSMLMGSTSNATMQSFNSFPFVYLSSKFSYTISSMRAILRIQSSTGLRTRSDLRYSSFITFHKSSISSLINLYASSSEISYCFIQHSTAETTFVLCCSNYKTSITIKYAIQFPCLWK